MVFKDLKAPLYRGRLKLIAYHNPEDMVTWFHKNCPDLNLTLNPADHVGFFFVSQEVQHIAIQICDDITPGIIAHECKHAVNDKFLSIGAKLDPVNDEPEAYLLMWYVDQVWDFWKNVKTKHHA